MLRSRLETAIDMNYIQFNYENDKKRRENEVRDSLQSELIQKLDRKNEINKF